MLTRIPSKQTFTYYFFLIFAQPSLELPVAAPLIVPTPGETQQDFTQSAADICHATKPGCHSSVGCASRDAICGSPCAIVSWEIPAVLRPGQPELSSLSPGSGCFLAPSCCMSDEGWEREPGHVVLWKTGGYESGPWWTSQGQPLGVPAPLPTSCYNNHTDPHVLQPGKQTAPAFHWGTCTQSWQCEILPDLLLISCWSSLCPTILSEESQMTF